MRAITESEIIPERPVDVGGRLGRHILHDPRSRRFAVQPARAIETVSWTRRVPVFDQGDLGSCTGNASVGALATDPFYDTVADLVSWPLNEAMAQRIYSEATAIDPWPGQWPPTDTGSDGLSVSKTLQKLGLISGYLHAFTLEQALSALQSGPVIVGSYWYANMDRPNSESIVTPSGAIRGGHEYVAHGVDTARDLVWFTNSWGTGYGIDGRFAMSIADFGALLRNDGDLVSFVPNTKPAPTPTPSTDPDDVFALELHRWLDRCPFFYKATQKAARAWLAAKGL